MVHWNLDSLGVFLTGILSRGKMMLDSVSITFFGYTFTIWHYILSVALIETIIKNLAPWYDKKSMGGGSD